jgi:hypothetical protein
MWIHKIKAYKTEWIRKKRRRKADREAIVYARCYSATALVMAALSKKSISTAQCIHHRRNSDGNCVYCHCEPIQHYSLNPIHIKHFFAPSLWRLENMCQLGVNGWRRRAEKHEMTNFGEHRTHTHVYYWRLASKPLWHDHPTTVSRHARLTNPFCVYIIIIIKQTTSARQNTRTSLSWTNT